MPNDPTDIGDSPDLTIDLTNTNVPFELGNSAKAAETEHPRITPSEKILIEQQMQEHQNTAWRTVLFWLAVILVSLSVVASLLFGAWYFFTAKGQADGVVLSTWFGANVVQVVGILVVITRHLFPDRGSTTRPPTDK